MTAMEVPQPYDDVEKAERLRRIAVREQERFHRLQDEQKKALKSIEEEQSSYDVDSLDSQERFKLLLDKVKVFTDVRKEGPPSPEKGKAAASLSSPSRRKRKSEFEEDEELLHELEEDEQEEDTTDAGHTRITETPFYINEGKLRDYQVHGLNWLIKLYDGGVNGILADEMGLGKTLQTISFVGYLKHFRGVWGPHLIIAPKSVLPNWQREINRWCPSLRAFRFHGLQEDRERQKAEMMEFGAENPPFDCCLTTYEMCIREKSILSKFKWRYIIIDEAHRIKNENSLLSQVVRIFPSEHRLLLTGTPLQNNLHELWALLNFLLPDLFRNSTEFDDWFDAAQGKNDSGVVEQLHRLLKPFMLRRLKADVERTLPPKKEIWVHCGLSSMQKHWYKNILFKDIDAINGQSGQRMRLLNIIMQLRKCCNHPYLFDGAEPGPPYSDGPHLFENSGKMIVLHRLLSKLKQSGNRVLIFSQMSRMLDILEDYCLMLGHEYCRLDGQTSTEDREAMMEAYNAENSSKFIFLLTTRAGGLGINLATADTVIIYDSDWNPQMDLQAQDRAHRIGQKKPVNVYRFITENTVERRIVERACRKLYLDAVVVQQGRLVEKQKQASREELLSMVKFGAQEILDTTEGTVTDDDIDAILARGEDEARVFTEKLKQNCEQNLLDFTFDDEDESGLYEFDGVDYSDLPTRTVRIADIPEGITASELQRAVGVEVEKMRMFRARGVVVLTFAGVDGAETARENLAKSHSDWSVSYLPEKKKEEDQALVVQDVATILYVPKRERKKTFNVDDYYRDIMRQAMGHGEGPKMPRMPKLPQLHDFQFYNSDRLKELVEKERDALKAVYDAKARAMREGVAAPDAEPPLTDTEQEEKERLLEEGFGDWNKRDYYAFIRGCEKFGRDDIENVATEVEGKSLAEVKAYGKVFFSRIEELEDCEKVLKRIEKGEANIVRREEIAKMLQWKTSQYKNPWLQLQITYSGGRGKGYIEEEDRWLVCMMAEAGYGNWDEIRWRVRSAPEFRFDWFMKSRTAVEIGRRCDTLIRHLEKEWDDQKKKKSQKTPTKKAAAASKKRKTDSGAKGSAKKSKKK